MDLKFFYAKQLYLVKQKIDRLSERDRILLLFITIVILLFLWFFAVVKPILKSKYQKEQQIQKIDKQITILTQKKKIVEILISNPETVKVINQFKELTTEITTLDKEIIRYNKRYIAERDLAKLLHDMLKQTMGVTIENFGTVTPLPSPPSINQQTTNTAAPKTSPVQTPALPLTIQANHYRLIMRGTYFPVMRYLQRLEQLPWQLYWDKFDYTVTKYPQGLVTIDFYTLKPKSAQLIIKKGHNQ
ncbi:type II secretion system protein M [Fluoribacter gormanii]|uniref:General secretion pathway, M protein n=1 Tax=Fluoribacter gormanii TaxID=464 RepID=A0A377GMP4_9GAMM|nr:type II secretion system protein M [Fluoribacter gormanii]KTD05590.1 General secretion pathway, M protein [Fluoribacter gormanii]MCW8442626.1 type II secretion system protein M [Fluoribacter gormanii]SIQ68110.1 MSHA biogenesis protein MshJ [Fluoribacter gormanii]STO25765.1 General secretion pathway, M protein [Fluoribacter gormanii]